MKIAVIDDNQIFVEKAMTLIKRHCGEMGIPCSVSGFQDGYSFLEIAGEFDLVFLDIDMPAINGLEVAKTIAGEKSARNSPLIVFVTNKDNLVFEALKQYPLSFIRKPTFESDIRSCLNKAYEQIGEKCSLYMIKSGRDTVNLRVSDIAYIVKENNYVVFHTSDGQFKERSTIIQKQSDLESLGFLRPNIGYLVNFQYIQKLSKQSILLSNQIEIAISRKYRKDFIEKYHRMVVNKV